MELVGVLVAAGSSRRMGRDKLWIEIAGRPVWRWSLDLLLSRADMRTVAVVTPPGSEDEFRARVPDASRCLFVSGGTTRADSVLAGLDALGEAGVPPDAFVLVHDAARPAASANLVERVVREAASSGAAVPVVKVRDALWRAEGANGFGASLAESADRENLVGAQTPQAARLAPLAGALRAARAGGIEPADEAAALVAAGGRVTTVPGEQENLKLTDPGDEAVLRAVLLRRAVPLSGHAREVPPTARAGIGFDAHRFATGRALRLGGVDFPDEPRGLEGHSDGDAALHAVIDALLGAAALGDIGRLFPEDERWRDVRSADLVTAAAERLREAGWVAASIDLTIAAARPAIAPRAAEMAARIAVLTGAPLGAVSVKATTTDGLGFPAAEGIAAYASAVVVPIADPA